MKGKPSLKFLLTVGQLLVLIVAIVSCFFELGGGIGIVIWAMLIIYEIFYSFIMGSKGA